MREAGERRVAPVGMLLLRGRRAWLWAPDLATRLALGVFFAMSGAGKVFDGAHRAQLEQTLVAAGIPLPSLGAVFVSWLELTCGLALVVGLLTTVACVLLACDMAVAIVTTRLATIPAGVSPVAWLGDFLYLPEVLLVVLLCWVAVFGPGRLSLDAVLLGQERLR
jgi:putative oxidoreductase